MCVLSSHFLDIRLVDATAGVTQQEEGHRISPPSLCGTCLNFFSWEGFSRPFPSSTVMSKSVHPRINRSPLVGHDNIIILKASENGSGCSLVMITSHVKETDMF